MIQYNPIVGFLYATMAIREVKAFPATAVLVQGNVKCHKGSLGLRGKLGRRIRYYLDYNGYTTIPHKGEEKEIGTQETGYLVINLKSLKS